VKTVSHAQLKCAFFGALVLPIAAMAQFDGKTCTAVPAATTTIPSPGSGSMTVGPLTKFGLPAQVCATVGFTGAAISYDYTTTLATTYSNAKFPSSCAGVEYGLSGGPVYSAVTGKGNFAFNLANPTAPMTGTIKATSFSMTENLTLSAGGANFVISTGLLSFNTDVTINADQSIDIKVCTPKGGIPTTVNGANVNVPSNIWQCLAVPPAASTQSNVRITYVEGC
jgi:hypothetical protein